MSVFVKNASPHRKIVKSFLASVINCGRLDSSLGPNFIPDFMLDKFEEVLKFLEETKVIDPEWLSKQIGGEKLPENERNREKYPSVDEIFKGK